MQWSWSLHLCQLVTEDCSVVGVSRALRLDASAVPVLREGGASPSLAPGVAAVATYVDNGNVLAGDAATAAKALGGFLAELRRRNLEYHEVVPATQDFVTGGTCFDLRSRRCGPNPARAWRLYAALSEVVCMGDSTGAAVSALLGHLT